MGKGVEKAGHKKCCVDVLQVLHLIFIPNFTGAASHMKRIFVVYKKQDASVLPHKYARAVKGRNLRQAWEEQERQGGAGGGT